jgi:hypothetical protein
VRRNVADQRNAALEQNQHQGDGADHAACLAECFRRHLMGHGTEDQAEDGEKQNVGNACALKERHEVVGQKHDEPNEKQ